MLLPIIASDDAQWVTGQRLMVSGGTKLGRFHDAAARLKGLDAKHSLVPEERSRSGSRLMQSGTSRPRRVPSIVQQPLEQRFGAHTGRWNRKLIRA